MHHGSFPRQILTLADLRTQISVLEYYSKNLHQNMTETALQDSLMVGIKVSVVGWVQNDDLSKMPF